MTYSQLRAFAESSSEAISRVALTREGARRLLADIEAADESPPAFDLSAHLSSPSRERPLASAAAVNLLKEKSNAV